MTTIVVTGAGSKKQADTIVQACRFYLRKLGFRKRKRELEIYISFSNKQEEMGLCDFNNDFTFPEIDITIKKSLSEEERLQTLAHELVHAKQFLRRQLRFSDHTNYWCGKPSTNEEWETEAYLKEEQLYNEYINERAEQRASHHSIQHIS